MSHKNVRHALECRNPECRKIYLVEIFIGNINGVDMNNRLIGSVVLIMSFFVETKFTVAYQIAKFSRSLAMTLASRALKKGAHGSPLKQR